MAVNYKIEDTRPPPVQWWFNWHEEPKEPPPKKLIILTAAPGNSISKAHNPNIPCTPEEIARHAAEAYKAGASMYHVHVRDENCVPTRDLKVYAKVVRAIKERCPDMIIDLCMALPMVDDRVEARLKPLCELGLPIEIGTFSMGSMNVGRGLVYISREEYLREAAKYLQSKGIKPCMTVYNRRMIDDVKDWIINSGTLKQRPYFNMSIGNQSEPARFGVLRSMVECLPPNSDWICESMGRKWLQPAVEAILLGGHVRAGMEDGIYMYPHKDDLIKSCAEAVGKIVRIAGELGREVATPDEAREILGLKTSR